MGVYIQSRSGTATHLIGVLASGAETILLGML